ncbi:hypothetical protein Hypma_012591 [Hypsizygus marmoreus]|uniref:Uncharacterized protein n=1 Tax=Hypsizygus marmoreus TaxID=39966 RepID=A0A369JDX3_HYPMA|nr:hypothetical protein Hypma_012591 [Hypsizygus marmoreus]
MNFPSPQSILSLTQTQPLLSSLDDVKAFVRESIDDQPKPFFAAFNVSDNDVETVYDFLQARQYRNVRISCSDIHNVTLRYMPTEAHEVAVQHLTHAIISSVCHSNRLPSTFDFFDSIKVTGATTIFLDKPQKLFKEPDQSFMSRIEGRRQYPLVVIEVGVPENMPQLKADASHWLLHTTVNMVIAMAIGPEAPTPDQNGRRTPLLQLCHYEKRAVDPSKMQPGRATTELVTTLDVKWTDDEAISDHSIPGCHFFVEGTSEYQAFATGDHPLVIKREVVLALCNDIRESWRDDWDRLGSGHD